MTSEIIVKAGHLEAGNNRLFTLIGGVIDLESEATTIIPFNIPPLFTKRN